MTGVVVGDVFAIRAIRSGHVLYDRDPARKLHMSQTQTITNRRRVDTDGGDFYPTPSWATRALLDAEKFTGTIWEPACGNGCMSWVLETTGCTIVSSDLYDRGYGTTGVDFLTRKPIYPDNVVTNPPFNLAEEFVKVALSQAQRKVAFLLRLQFLSGAGRQREIYVKTPPTRVHIFSERITMYPNGVQTAGSGTTDYAWFVWGLEHPNDCPELRWIPVGARRKYSGVDL